MYGTWFTITLGFIGAVLFVVAAVATAWTPLFAFALAALAIGLLLPVISRRRQVSEKRSDPAAPTGGAPASGEGGEGSNGSPEAAHRARQRRSSRVTEGIWGERRGG